MKRDLLNSICLDLKSSVRDVIANLEESGLQIVIILSDDRKLLGVITDGDIRRGLIQGYGVDTNVKEIMITSPVVVNEFTSLDESLEIMSELKIHHIPVVDKENNLVDLYLFDDKFISPEYQNTLVIMAGGFGRRLMPHTKNCPKPMLPVSGKPMLEHILERAISQGFKNFVISVFYLPDMIRDHFKNGESWNVKIEYIQESDPLGTAGALSLLSKDQILPIIVTNGDLISDIGYREILEYHSRHNAVATMAVKNHEIQNPYGVVKIKGVDITGFDEKPIYHSIVNAGIYILEPKVLDLLNKNEVCDMPTLFQRLQNNHLRTIVFPMHERWLDVGKPHDLENATNHIQPKTK